MTPSASSVNGKMQKPSSGKAGGRVQDTAELQPETQQVKHSANPPHQALPPAGESSAQAAAHPGAALPGSCKAESPRDRCSLPRLAPPARAALPWGQPFPKLRSPRPGAAGRPRALGKSVSSQGPGGSRCFPRPAGSGRPRRRGRRVCGLAQCAPSPHSPLPLRLQREATARRALRGAQQPRGARLGGHQHPRQGGRRRRAQRAAQQLRQEDAPAGGVRLPFSSGGGERGDAGQQQGGRRLAGGRQGQQARGGSGRFRHRLFPLARAGGRRLFVGRRAGRSAVQRDVVEEEEGGLSPPGVAPLPRRRLLLAGRAGRRGAARRGRGHSPNEPRRPRPPGRGGGERSAAGNSHAHWMRRARM